ncbi:MAG: type II toxin-antitoxin system VapC family toxin [Deltaproteobacteria bacterium]|nr:type II toxin-antitoxin system VapC family toxin [Deltaproteobacteria bacterium]
MRLFLDSSALAKRYLDEAGSELVAEQCTRATEILLSVIAIPEVLSALNRLRREGHMQSPQYRRLKSTLMLDVEQAAIVELSPAVVQKTVHCIEHCAVKTLDAIQIASALIAECDRFLSADHRQLAAAKRMGLRIAAM